MNIDLSQFLDFRRAMGYFWLYRVRDNRPLEGSSGVVSQTYGIWLANQLEQGFPPIRRFIQSQAYAMKQCFLVYFTSDLLLGDLSKVDPKG